MGLNDGTQPLLSWGLAYNLYADKLLKLNLFPRSVYDRRKTSYCYQRGVYLYLTSLNKKRHGTKLLHVRTKALQNILCLLRALNLSESYGIPLDTRYSCSV